MSSMPHTFSGFGLAPSFPIMWPRNFTQYVANEHFSLFRVMPSLCNLSSVDIRWMPCSSLFFPWIRISSMREVTPSRPSWAMDMRHWKSSGAEEIPKGRRLKQNIPYGVINVVKWANSLDKGTCQKPEFVSSLVKNCGSASCIKVWSTDGSMCHSHCILLLRWVKSTHIPQEIVVGET